MTLKQNKKIFIATITGCILLFTVVYYLYSNKTNVISKCASRGGFWGGTGMCYPWKDLALKK